MIARAVLATALALGASVAFAETLKIGGTGAALGTMRLLGFEFSKTHPAIRIEVLPYIGSTGAIKSVDSGAIDLGVSGRPAKPAEEKLDAKLSRYALTPLVIAAHPGTGIESLTRPEIAAIYAGKQTRWRSGSPIRIILRAAYESDNDVLRTMSPAISAALGEALARPGMRYAPTDQDAAEMIEQTPGALGTTTLALFLSERRKLAIVAVDGIKPDIETMTNEKYPYNKPLYLVARSSPSPAVKAFVDFIRSPPGRNILLKNGQLAVKN